MGVKSLPLISKETDELLKEANQAMLETTDIQDTPNNQTMI